MNAAVSNFADPDPLNWPRKAVQDIAAQIAKKLNYRPGDDLRAIIKSLGGRIQHTDWDSAQNTGSIQVNGPGDFDIFLSPLSGPRRCRFTIAHELGHYVLHSQNGKKKIRVKRDGSGRVEWEANWFASGFLMPEAEFKEKRAQGFGDAELAEHFGVSEQAIAIRAGSL